MNNIPNINPMGGPVGGAPVPMMHNGAMNPQAAPGAPGPRSQQVNDSQRGVLNTYIYEYFIRYGMFDCARSLLSSDQQVNVLKDGKGSNSMNGAGDEHMDTDSKDDIDSKIPDDLPQPKLPMPASDSSFLYEWFCLFWDIYNAQRAKSGNPNVNQYVTHTQQELLRQMRPETAQQQYHHMMRMQNGALGGINMKQPANLARAAMANNQNNPQIAMQMQQAKQAQMQRDPSSMDGNQNRPASPSSGENAPSPSKRQRVDNAPFNPNQPGAMMPNGRPGMPPQQMPGAPNAAAAQQMLANGLNPSQMQQFQNFQHHGNQMGNKQMPNAAGPQGQGSPPLMHGPDGTTLNNYYNPPGGEMGGPNGLRAGPAGQAPGGSNHALQDYQMQLMLLEQQNKKRLMMARQEQDSIGTMPRDGSVPGPGGAVPTGPNGQPFPETSPQAMRSGTSPNPAEQMKRGTPQMNNAGIPSPVPEGGQQSRGSPNPGMNFMPNADPNMAPHFFNKGAEAGMNPAQPQMNGMRPPSSHPGQVFNGQMNPAMMAARQQQAAAAQGNPQAWQGPNGQMMPQGMPQNPQAQGTPQQRAMPPPSAPANAAANPNSRTTASPQQPSAQPPTPNQANKPAPKKKETKGTKKGGAANKKANQNANNTGATPAAESNAESENPPATPITPVTAGFKNGQNNVPNNQSTSTANAQSAAAPVGPPPGQPDMSQNSLALNNDFSMNFMDMDNSLQTGDVLNDFDFDSFLHDGDGDNQPFDFNGAFSAMDGNEISTEQ